MMPRLILASTSAYRRELLGRLHLDFDTARPEVDEHALPGETPQALATRLAGEKARAVAVRFPEAWVIGSDQVADLDGQALGKPGTLEQARAQLTRMSGRMVRFQTAVSLIGPDGFAAQALDLTDVQVRPLQPQENERYLATKPATLALGSREGQIQLGKHALPHDAACEHCLLAALLLTPHDWTWRRAAPTHASAGSDVCASNVPRFASSTAHRPRGPPMAA